MTPADDGPNPDYTEELLTGLKERGVNATFFLLGKEVEKYPEIVKDISDGGHLIGTHSYEHVNLSNLSDAAAIEQVDKTNALDLDFIGLAVNNCCVFHRSGPSFSLNHCCLSDVSGTRFTDVIISLSTGIPDSILSAP